MAKKVPIERLADSIDDILREYVDDIDKDMDTAVRKVTQAGARAVSASARGLFGGSGKYAKGWKAKIEKKRLGTVGTIHNATVPGLPHLLEKGHAKRGGGRVPGRTHIAPVEDKIVKQFEDTVRAKI